MNKVLLYLSSYVPLYLILIIKNVILKLENRNWNLGDIKLFNTLDDLVLVVLAILVIILLIYIEISLRNIKKYNSNKYFVFNINNNSSDSILNYISIYILTFIEFNLNSWSNVGTLILLVILLGIISVKYDDLYINPTLLVWKGYRIYNVSIQKENGVFDKIVLVKGNLYKNTEIQMYDSNNEYTFAEKIDD